MYLNIDLVGIVSEEDFVFRKNEGEFKCKFDTDINKDECFELNYVRQKDISKSEFISGKHMEDIIKKAKNCSIFLHWRIIVKKIAPRNVLPISPINNLDGCQLKIKNANNEDTIGIYIWFKKIDAIIKITKKHPVTMPSIPSIKLVKLIEEIPTKTKKGKIK